MLGMPLAAFKVGLLGVLLVTLSPFWWLYLNTETLILMSARKFFFKFFFFNFLRTDKCLTVWAHLRMQLKKQTSVSAHNAVCCICLTASTRDFNVNCTCLGTRGTPQGFTADGACVCSKLCRLQHIVVIKTFRRFLLKKV